VTAPRDPPNIHAIMFTDVEASTRLTESLGDDAARALLREHDRTVTSVAGGHKGTIIKHTGDGFLASFPSTSAALSAAIDIQRDLEPAAADGVRVRIGVHAGEPIEEDGDIHGTSVIRTSRIVDTAHAGQILVSSLVRELVAGRPFRFVDRGMHELKGIGEPQRLHELVWMDGAEPA